MRGTTEANSDSRQVYFTPSVEDIRIGYEMYAPLIDKEGNDTGEMTKVVVDRPDWADVMCDITIGENGVKTYKLGSVWKVPYLTKEQIEAEGWKLIVQVDHFKRFGYEKDNLFLTLDFSGKLPMVDFIFRDISLEIGRYNNPERFRIWVECKCINTFRTICKLID